MELVDLVVINLPLTAWTWKGSTAASQIHRRKSFSRGILCVFAACIHRMKAVAIFLTPGTRFLSGKFVQACLQRHYIEVSKFDMCRFGSSYKGSRAVLATRGLLLGSRCCQGGHTHSLAPAFTAESPLLFEFQETFATLVLESFQTRRVRIPPPKLPSPSQ